MATQHGKPFDPLEVYKDYGTDGARKPVDVKGTTTMVQELVEKETPVAVLPSGEIVLSKDAPQVLHEVSQLPRIF